MPPLTTARSRPSVRGRDPGTGVSAPTGFGTPSPSAAGTGCPVQEGCPGPCKARRALGAPGCTPRTGGGGSVGWPSPPAPGSEGLGWGSPGGRGTEEKPSFGRGSALRDFAEAPAPLSPRGTSAVPSLCGFTSNKPLVRPGMSRQEGAGAGGPRAGGRCGATLAKGQFGEGESPPQSQIPPKICREPGI